MNELDEIVKKVDEIIDDVFLAEEEEKNEYLQKNSDIEAQILEEAEDRRLTEEELKTVKAERQYISDFFKEINKYDYLTLEREQELFAICRDDNSSEAEKKDAENEIVNSHLRLLASVIAEKTRNYSITYVLDADLPQFYDLVAAGTIRMHDAVKEYIKDNAPYRFNFFVRWRIVEAINEEKRNSSSHYLTEKDSELNRKIKEIEDSYKKATGIDATEIDLLDGFDYSGDNQISEYNFRFLKLYRKLNREPNDNEISGFYGSDEDIEILKSMDHLRKKGDISIYEYTWLSLWKKNGHVPNDDDIRAKHLKFLEHIRSLKEWVSPKISLDNSNDDEKKSSLVNVIPNIVQEQSKQYEYDLSAIELIVLYLEGYELPFHNDYDIDIEKLVRNQSVPEKGTEEYKAIFKRATDKIDATVYGNKAIKSETKVFVKPSKKKGILSGDITRKANMLFKEMNDSLSKMVSKEEMLARYELMEAANAKSISEAAMWHSKIVNTLNKAGYEISNEAGLEELKSTIDLLKSKDQMLEDLVYNLYSIYDSFPETQDYLRRVIKNCGCDYIKDSDSVRVAIVKQFMAKTRYNTLAINNLVREIEPSVSECKNYSFEIINAIDERVFAIYENTKGAGEKWPLLRLAKDLQDGLFKTNFSTRKDLYYFAFAFELKAYGSRDINDGYNPVYDLEKNLFEDYYNNDYLVYLRNVGNNTFETEPTGEGVNYKNFAELIYVYYLNQEELTVTERIKGAENTISQCIKRFKEDELFYNEEDDLATSNYKKEFWINICKDGTEEDLVQFVVDTCIIPENINTGSKLAAASNSVTGFAYTKEFIDYISNSRGSRQIVDRNEAQKLLVKKIEQIVKKDESKYSEGDKFIQIIKRIDEFVNLGRLDLDDKNYKQSRTKLLTAAYFVYRLKADPSEFTFLELYNDFAGTVNKKLVKSRYQRLSKKNIFDIYLVLLLYYTYNVL